MDAERDIIINIIRVLITVYCVSESESRVLESEMCLSESECRISEFRVPSAVSGCLGVRDASLGVRVSEMRLGVSESECQISESRSRVPDLGVECRVRVSPESESPRCVSESRSPSAVSRNPSPESVSGCLGVRDRVPEFGLRVAYLGTEMRNLDCVSESELRISESESWNSDSDSGPGPEHPGHLYMVSAQPSLN